MSTIPGFGLNEKVSCLGQYLANLRNHSTKLNRKKSMEIKHSVLKFQRYSFLSKKLDF